MNKVLLTILLTALAISLAGQTGLFEISYDAGRKATLDNLFAKGFAIDSETDLQVRMVAVDSSLVQGIDLQFSPADSTLVSWMITYLPQLDEDIAETVLDALVSWHGDVFEYDDYFEEYYWDLGNDRYVYAYYDWDYATFYAEYVGPGGD